MALLAAALDPNPAKQAVPYDGEAPYSSVGWSIEPDGMTIELVFPKEEIRWAEVLNIF